MESRYAPPKARLSASFSGERRMNVDFACPLLLRDDPHIDNAAPSPFGRLLDDFALLQQASAAGMAGIVLKSHYESTADRAFIANRYAKATTLAYGALALNCPVGGLNPYAVQDALKRGARIIYMPTRDAANSLVSGNMPGDFFDRSGFAVCDKDGRLKREVYEIFDAVKGSHAALATGHISPKESLVLCREGIANGVKMVLTHPEFSRTQCPAALQKELAETGVLIEHCWYNLAEGECSSEQMAANIRAAGAERCYISTDRGQSTRETPVQAMKHFICTLLCHGLSQEELRIMLTAVPQRVLFR